MTQRTKVTLLLSSLVLIVGLSCLHLAYAQDTGNSDTDQGLVQCGNKVGDPCTVEDVFNIFVIGTNILIGAVGLVAIISIVWAGFSMVMSVGNTEAISKAKKNLTGAITGLILVALAFMLINFIIYGILGATGNNEGVFNPLEYITGGGSGAPANGSSTPTNQTPTNSGGK